MVWTAIAWMFSAFLAGYVAVWMSGLYSYWEGMFHSWVTWGVLMSALAYLPTYGDLAFLGRETATMPLRRPPHGGCLRTAFSRLFSQSWEESIGSRAARRMQIKEQYEAASAQVTP